MKIAWSVMIASQLSGTWVAAEGIHSGHAKAELLVASASFEAGEPIRAALKLTMDEGWHTYWVNPGEGGMKLRVEWDLPEGWKAGEINYPVPIQFMTGDLPGFGYEDEVVFPVTIFPGETAEDEAKITLKASWLTCDQAACVPGDAELSRTLSKGPDEAGKDAAEIAKATKLVPKPLEGLTLNTHIKGEDITLVLTLPEGSPVDPAQLDGFAKTSQVIDNAALIRFELVDEKWIAVTRKNEYAAEEIKELTLVLAGPGAEQPLEVTWTGAEGDS